MRLVKNLLYCATDAYDRHSDVNTRDNLNTAVILWHRTLRSKGEWENSPLEGSVSW